MDAFETLNQKFADCTGLEFVKIGDLILAKIDTPLAQATVAVQGAQIIEWKPVDEDQPVVWRAKKPTYEAGKSVRGGVPICWPWFGNHPTLTMAHGFVRFKDWTLMNAQCDSEGQVHLHWRITDDAESLALWPHRFELDAIMHIGTELRIQLVTHNTGDASFSITQGLHTYLNLGDTHSTVIRGLEGGYYLDKLKGFSRTPQEDIITITGPMDRIYFGTTHTVEVEDSEFNRVIVVAKEGSHSTVVWNPDENVPSGMQPEESRNMVCVEAVNAADDTVSIAPGERKILGTTISVRSMG